MPTLAGTNGFEYDMEIVHSGTTYSIDNGDFTIENKKLMLELGDPKIPCLQFDINLSATTRLFAMMDRVKLKTRAIGESTWLYRFSGYLAARTPNSRKQIINCMALGHEFLFKNTDICYMEYGNTYVEDQVLKADIDGDGYPYFSLDSDAPLQIPLERVRIHSGQGGTMRGPMAGPTQDIYNESATSYRECGINFHHPGGRLFGLCFKMTKAGVAAKDLLVEIYNVVSSIDMSPTGAALITGSLTDGSGVTGWSYVNFEKTNQDQNLLPGDYIARFYHAESVSSDLSNPFWMIDTISEGWGEGVPNGSYSRDSTSTWAFNGGLKPLFMPNSENHYIDMLYGEEYYFPWGGNRAYIKWKNKFYDGDLIAKKLIRATYWKGNLDFSATIEDFLQDWAKEFYDTLDIVVTAPTVKFQVLKLAKTNVWDTMQAFRKIKPISWRIWEEVSGTLTLEVRDKEGPDNWASQTTEYQEAHTFKHGYDGSTSDNYVCIKDDSLHEEIGNIANRAMVDNGAGDVVVVGDASGTLGSGGFNLMTPITLPGASLNDLGIFGQMVFGQMRTIIKGGQIELEHIDLSTSSALFVTCNEIINIIDSDTGFNGQYAIETLVIDFGNGGHARLKLVDDVYNVFIKSGMGMNPGMGGIQNMSNDFVLSKIAGIAIQSSPVNTGPIGSAATAGGLQSGFMAASGGLRQMSNDILYMTEADADDWIDPGGTDYYIAIGNLSPLNSSTLGNELLEKQANIMTCDSSHLLLWIDVNEWELTADVTTPVYISEVKLRESVGGASLTKSIGTPKDGAGPFNLAYPRPTIYRDGGRVKICIKLHAS